MISKALVLFEKNKEKEITYRINEMRGLLSSLNIEFESKVVRVDSISKSTYVGSGTVENLKEYIYFVSKSEKAFDFLITDFNLTGIQKDNLEEELDIEVIDKTMVILKVFESRARTKESKLQVEIAKLQYQATQLVHKDANYSQVTSGSGHNKGSGEKEKELDKRRIYHSIHKKKIELEQIKNSRKTGRKLRKNNEIPVVAVVGYTNAGKSTLINYFLENSKSSDDKLLYSEDIVFATLETSTRLINIYGYPSFLLTDTVGFMRDLPHFLINAFRSTLEEIIEADLIVQVVDISDEDYKERMEITNTILDRLQVQNIDKVILYNKCDLIDNNYPFIPDKNEMFASLKDEETDMNSIIRFILQKACKNWIKHKIILPYEEDISTFMFRNLVLERREKEDGVHITALMSPKYFNYYSRFITL